MEESSTRHDAIRNLQRYLRRLSYEQSTITPVPVDGIFESETEEALSEFQRLFGLPVTGRADRESYDALFKEYEQLSRKDKRVPVDFFPVTPENYETKAGETSAFVTLIQFMLGELTLFYDAFEPPARTGVLDKETEEAIRRFQEIHALPQTGRIDRLTWNRLSEEYKNYLTYPL